MRTALITGILGQDGSFLAERLRSDGYRVVGLELAAAAAPVQGFELLIGDVADRSRVEAIVEELQPHEIYHLAGQTSVGLSFQAPGPTFESVANGTLSVLEAVRTKAPEARVVVASSGEVFGDTGGRAATEETPFRPASPYGAAKSAAAHLTATYRASFGVFAALAFFYNHESPRRPERFVTRKVVRTACLIARGRATELELGDTSVVRDWGYAPEYVDAAVRMLRLERAEDFVIATGRSCSLAQFVEKTFACVDLDFRRYVKRAPALFRSSEIPAMYANPARASERLGWRAEVHVDALVERLVRAEMMLLDAGA